MRPLAPAEIRVLTLAADGKGNKEIATELGLSESTIKNEMSAIFHALGVTDRTSAVVMAARLGLIDICGHKEGVLAPQIRDWALVEASEAIGKLRVTLKAPPAVGPI